MRKVLVGYVLNGLMRALLIEMESCAEIGREADKNDLILMILVEIEHKSVLLRACGSVELLIKQVG